MSWSKTPPTESGFWWHRHLDDKGRPFNRDVMHVIKFKGKLVGYYGRTVESLGGEWWSEKVKEPGYEREKPQAEGGM